jgi:outer membrane protein OmpA-like peptidoglycan-associated protein
MENDTRRTLARHHYVRATGESGWGRQPLQIRTACTKKMNTNSFYFRGSLLLWIFITTGVTGCNTSRQPSSETGSAPAASNIHGANTGKPDGEAGIIAAIQQSIASDPKIKGKEIQVRFERGTVKLTGTVANEEEAAAAGFHALEVAGVEGVANHLLYPVAFHTGSENRQVPAQDVIDAAIDAVQEKIHSDPNIKGTIQVRFSHPSLVMQLTGKVDTEDQRTAVLNDAAKVTDLGVGSSVDCVCADEPSSLFFSAPAPPWTGPPAPLDPIVPLCPGLTVVTAVAQPQGDYESIKTIEAADSKQVRLKYSAEVMQPWWQHPHPELVRTVTHRTILTSELESAHSYNQLFVSGESSTESPSGATAIGTSAAVLKELKTTGESVLNLCGAAGDGMMTDPATGQLHSVRGCYNFLHNTLKRAGNEPVRLRVLMNGVPADLPAVHARADQGERDEFFFLDDERNPLTLAFRLGIGGIPALPPSVRERCETLGKQGRYGLDGYSCDLPNGGDRDVLRVVKIETKCEALANGSPASGKGVPASGGAAALEKSLSESETVDLYSIYFSFNSDEIRDESEPTLNEIAEVLRKHTDWKLRVAGHTDGIGNDEKNLDLSKRRSVAVKDALVKRYKIDAGRLSTTGFGKSQPKDTNDTIEGRARNRRVELMKIS